MGAPSLAPTQPRLTLRERDTFTQTESWGGKVTCGKRWTHKPAPQARAVPPLVPNFFPPPSNSGFPRARPVPILLRHAVGDIPLARVGGFVTTSAWTDRFAHRKTQLALAGAVLFTALGVFVVRTVF